MNLLNNLKNNFKFSSDGRRPSDEVTDNYSLLIIPPATLIVSSVMYSLSLDASNT